MATSLLALLDDIASLLDDVSAYSKVAASKTAPVIGDDLALNAQQLVGMKASRELPVIWAVAKGAIINKVILVPLALIISAIYPPLISWLLMLGGAYLCFEGAEKLWHSLFPEGKASQAEFRQLDEKQKIKGAVRTDFILSAEIVVIALGSMSEASLSAQAVSLSIFALAITAFIYGLVAGIVKIDDLGLHCLQSNSAFIQGIGRGLLSFAPKLMKTLSVLGTLAMFLVGGGILAHGIHLVDLLGMELGTIANIIIEGVFGVVVGAILVLLLRALHIGKDGKSKHGVDQK